MSIGRIAIVGLTATAAAMGGAATASSATADTQRYHGAWGPHQVLQRGVQNENVRALQWMLNCEGFFVTAKPTTGFYDKTETQVKAVQTKRNIKEGADGKVGAATWNSLFDYTKPLYQGQRNDCVKALQVLLNKWTWKGTVDLKIDGAFGGNTDKKLKRFQQEYGIPHPGNVYDSTFNALVINRGNK